MAARIRGVLIDLSGTIHIENNVIPGAIEALRRLRGTGIPLRFVTNTTKESKETLLARLDKIGFEITSEEVFTSLTAARHLVESRKLRPMLFLEEDALKDFKGISCENPNSVVVGLAPECFHYELMNKAFRLLLEGHPLIAIHKVRYYRRSDGLNLGPGPFVSALEYAADVKADVVGKPEAGFFQQALSDINCDAESAVMIGDDARDDIAGAQSVGIKGILVQTGKYRAGDECRFSNAPFAVCEDFPKAVDYILSRI